MSEKDMETFVSMYQESTSLIRQEPTAPSGVRRTGLAYVDDPRFVAWLITIACGFNPNDRIPLPRAAAIGEDYDTYFLGMKSLVGHMTEDSTTMSGPNGKARRGEVLKLLAADSLTSTAKRRAINFKENFARGSKR